MGEKCVDGGKCETGKNTGGCYNTYQNNNATASSLLLRIRVLLGKFVKDSEGLVDLRVHRVGRLQEVEELRVVHLQEHAGDLTSKFGLGPTIDR